MSIQALSWVFGQDIKPSSLKFLLVGVANYADAHSRLWPSIDRLVKITNQNRKTVISGLNELEKRGYLVDTGERVGTTKSIKVYMLRAQTTQEYIENVAVPKMGSLKLSQKPPISSTENGNPPTPPIKINLKEPKKENNKKKNQVTLEKWEEVIGSQLCIEQMASWIKENRLDPEKIKILIPRFREKMISQGKLYANFIATFQVWLREGWLGMTFTGAQLSATVVTKVQIVDRGLTL